MIRIEEFRDKELIKISLLTENFKEYFIDSIDIVDLYIGDLLEIKYAHDYNGYIVNSIGTYEVKLVLSNNYLNEHKELSKALKLKNLTQIELFFKDCRINIDFPWDVTKDNGGLVNPSMKIRKSNSYTTIKMREFDNHETNLSNEEIIEKLIDIGSRYPNIKKIELYGDYALNKAKKDSLLILGLDVGKDKERVFDEKSFFGFERDIFNEIGKDVHAFMYKEVVKDKYLGSKGLVIK